MASSEINDLQLQAAASFAQAQYAQASALYEQLVEQDPDQRAHYWQLGLAYLLSDQETAAQFTWMSVLAAAESDQLQAWSAELIEALAQAAQQHPDHAEIIQFQIQQLLSDPIPDSGNDWLQQLHQRLQTQQFTPEHLQELPLLQFQADSPVDPDIDVELLLSVLEQVLHQFPDHPQTVEFVQTCLSYVQSCQGEQQIQATVDLVIDAAHRLFTLSINPSLACYYGECCYAVAPKHRVTLRQLASFYQLQGEYDKGIDFARQAYQLCVTTKDKLVGNTLILRGLFYAGAEWSAIETALNQQTALLNSWIEQPDLNSDQAPEATLLGFCLFFYPYFEDNPRQHRTLQNQVMQLAQQNIRAYVAKHVPTYQPYPVAQSVRSSSQKLRIGYLSHCLRRHSVGWLSRWLFRYHNRDRFEIYAYFNRQTKIDGFTQQWFADRSDGWRCLTGSEVETAQLIQNDAIDILVDLDSLTLDHSCAVMALKPAPVQVTWLGLDASGIPAIDYFIADPYVLPEAAQADYSEKIWRLPQTYIAVDGFEVDVPTLRREQLGIPADAVVYFSSQFVAKRHPETVRLQMEILKQVPNSYFLIKGLGNNRTIQAIFEQTAAEIGVERQRLRFLPYSPLEEIHRANLSLADVVLDTFPYNGATTTLETLWAGIPLVTKVGEQFAARNSYGMMINAGITEGIAWTNEEYVDWGVRFGQDAGLRQSVAWKLRQSRQTAPLWNAKQFTHSLEQAYEQMWQLHLNLHRR